MDLSSARRTFVKLFVFDICFSTMCATSPQQSSSSEPEQNIELDTRQFKQIYISNFLAPNNDLLSLLESLRFVSDRYPKSAQPSSTPLPALITTTRPARTASTSTSSSSSTASSMFSSTTQRARSPTSTTPQMRPQNRGIQTQFFADIPFGGNFTAITTENLVPTGGSHEKNINVSRTEFGNFSSPRKTRRTRAKFNSTFTGNL